MMMMFEMLSKIFAPNKKTMLSKDEIAEMLKISPEAYEEFEKQYKNAALLSTSDNFFDVNAKQAAAKKKVSYCIMMQNLNCALII
jgi:hypothetical protein